MILICVIAFLINGLCLAQDQDVHTVKLSACTSFIYPQTKFEKDGLYREMRKDDPSKIWFEYRFAEGQRQGPIYIYDSDGSVIAEGLFENNRLKHEALLIYEGGEKIELRLDYDCPGWFFQDNWIRQSGLDQHHQYGLFLWIAGQRYRLPNQVKSLRI